MRRRHRTAPQEHRVLFFGRRERRLRRDPDAVPGHTAVRHGGVRGRCRLLVLERRSLAAYGRRGVIGRRHLAAGQAEGRHRSQEDPRCRTASTRSTLQSDGTPRWTVQIDSPTAERLRVTVTDNSAGRLFSQLLDNSKVTIIRSSLSEYIKPIPLGSPISKYGNDPTVSGPQPNFWASIGAPYYTKSRWRSVRVEVRGESADQPVYDPEYRLPDERLLLRRRGAPG